MRALRAVLPYIRPYWKIYAGGLALTALSNVFTTLGPRFLGQGIDALAQGSGFRAVLQAVLLLLAVAIAGGVARFGMRQLLNSGSRRVEYDLRNDLFRHLARLSQEFYDRSATGDLMARSTNDLLAVRMAAGPAVMYWVDTVTRTLLVVPYMAAISLHLALLSLAPVTLLPVVIVFAGQAIHRRSLAIQSQFAELSNYVHENLSGVRIVRAYRQEEAETAQFRRLNDEYLARNVSLARAYGMFHPAMALLGGAGALAVLYFGGGMVMSGRITAGEYVAFGVYLMTLIWPMVALGWVINLVQRGAASMGRISAVLRERPVIVSPVHPAAIPASATARRLTAEGVWFRYPNAADRGWVLRDISFDIAPGRSLAIVGATGSGKSTLADLLVRTYDPDRGKILLDGVDLRDLSLEDLHRAVGFVPQETFLFSDTLRENILFGSPDDGRLEQAVETAQLSQALSDLPQGYDTLLGERGINLSGGQKQRAAIARALVKNPPVFVLDDALSAVDAHTEARILRNLRDALAGRTSVIISHRLAAVRDADWILVLDGGSIVEQGTHQELASRGGRYWDLLRRQQLEEELEVEGVG